MKKIKFIPFLFIALAFLTTSCAIDDDGALVPIDIVTKTVSFNETVVIVPASATPYDLAVYVDQAFGTDALVEYTINGAESGATIYGGSTVGSIPLDVSVDGTAYSITLTNVSVLNRPNDVEAVIGAMNTIQVIVLSSLPTPNPDSIELVFLNTDGQSSIWFGLSEFEADGNWVTDFQQNSNGSYPRMMSLPLDGDGTFGPIPNSADVAPNFIALNLYPQTTISDPMGYTIVAVRPDGTVEVLSGSLSSSTFVDNAIVAVEVTNDASNPGMKNYVFTSI